MGETNALQGAGAPVEFTVLHVEGFAKTRRDDGSPDLVPVGKRSRVTLRRPPDEVESAMVEFACLTCGRTVSTRVRSRAACSRLRRGRLPRGLVALFAAVLAVWMLVDTLPAGSEPPAGWILFAIAVAISSPWAAVYGTLWTVRALAGKGIAIEDEPAPRRMAGALGPEDQFHVDGSRFVKHSV